MAFILGVVDEGVQVITNNLGHTGRGNSDHVWLVSRLTVFQTVFHVLLTTEYRCVFRHGVGYTRNRFLEVTVEVSTEVSNTTLGTVHVWHGFLKTQRTQDCTQRLTGFGRVHGQGFALEVQFLVLFARGPQEGFVDFFLGVGFFEVGFLLFQHVLVFVFTKQRIARLNIVDLLTHDLLSSRATYWWSGG